MSENSSAKKPLLDLDQATFKENLSMIPADKVGWTNSNHWKLVEQMLASIKSDDGTPITSNAELMDLLKVIYWPNEDLKQTILRRAFAGAGYAIAPAADNILTMMFSAAQFADFLAKNNNPKTGKPFIQTERKRGAKKETFASLMSAAPSTEATSPAGEEQVTPETETDEKATQPATKATKK